MWIVSRARKNPLTGLHELVTDMEEKVNQMIQKEREMLEDGTYYISEKDPIIEVFGAEHGGRSRTVSNVIGATHVKGGLVKKGKRKVNATRSERVEDVRSDRVSLEEDLERLRAVDESPKSTSFRGSTCAFGGSSDVFPDIEDIAICDLLWPFNLSMELKIARGQVYPTRDMILNECPILEGYVKVQVDTVMEDYRKMPVPSEIQTDEIIIMKYTVSSFIQWPRKAIKICDMVSPQQSTRNTSYNSRGQLRTPPPFQQVDIGTSSCYRPHFEEAMPNQQMPSYEPNVPSCEQQTQTRHLSDSNFLELFEDPLRYDTHQSTRGDDRPKTPDPRIVEIDELLEDMPEQMTKSS